MKKLDDLLKGLLTSQVMQELSAAHTYLQVALHLEGRSYMGAARWFYNQHQEGPPLAVINLSAPDEESEDGVDARMMDEARELAARNPQLTRSYLERRLKIGGSKAEEVMETLEEEGFFDLR